MGRRDLAFKLEGQLDKRLLRWGVPTMEQESVETVSHVLVGVFSVLIAFLILR